MKLPIVLNTAMAMKFMIRMRDLPLHKKVTLLTEPALYLTYTRTKHPLAAIGGFFLYCHNDRIMNDLKQLSQKSIEQINNLPKNIETAEEFHKDAFMEL